MQVNREPGRQDAGEWTLVVAMSTQGVIGRGGELPWRLRSDLKRFKQRTMGQCLLMGRRTFESIGRALPGRQTIVLTRSPDFQAVEGVDIARDIGSIEGLVEPGRQVMVVGGAQIYEQSIDRCGVMWITRVDCEVRGDVCFPAIDWGQWRLESSQAIQAGPNDEWPTEFQVWKRKIRNEGI